MPSINDIIDEIRKEQQKGNQHDIVRRRYLEKLHQITDRNIIIYYSGFLQKQYDIQRNQSFGLFRINDDDLNGFMAVIHGLDRERGLDLLLDTPGGDAAATGAIIDYLRRMFGADIRVIVPQLAMSGGTVIACCAKEIIMAKHSSLGPIDPQLGMLSCYAIVEEFEKAKKEITADKNTIPYWGMLINKYPMPALYGEAKRAIEFTESVCKKALEEGMFANEPPATKQTKIDAVVNYFGDHQKTMMHGNHIPIDVAQDNGLVVTALEDNEKLQDAVLNVHHITNLTFMSTTAVKIIQNHLGKGYNLQFNPRK